jgi:hypothetical protein
MAKKKKPTGKVLTVSRKNKAAFVDMLANTELSIEEIVKRLATDKIDKRKVANELLHAVCPELFLCGVHHVVADYNGEGDSGDISGLYATDASGAYMAWPKGAEKFVDAVRRAIWEFIPEGFEINDGSYGEITIKIATNELVREHNERIVEIDSSEHKFTF